MTVLEAAGLQQLPVGLLPHAPPELLPEEATRLAVDLPSLAFASRRSHLPLLQPVIPGLANARLTPAEFVDAGMETTRAATVLGGAVELQVAAHSPPQGTSTLAQIQALKLISPVGTLGMAPGCLDAVAGMTRSAQLSSTHSGAATMCPALSTAIPSPFLIGGGLPVAADPMSMSSAMPFEIVATGNLTGPKHRAVVHTVSTGSSDDTASRGGSEPCGSSDSSDSGEKKCRAWKIMLTAQQAVEIYQQLPADTLHITSKSVAVGKQFGVSAKTIRDIWKRETWVKATRHVWSEADEKSYLEEESRKSAASASRGPPPGSVASLLSDDVDERSPSPLERNTSKGSRARGRPKGVKDSRPRKRRCMSNALSDRVGGGSSSSPHGSSQTAFSVSHSVEGSRSPCALDDSSICLSAGIPSMTSAAPSTVTIGAPICAPSCKR